MTRSFRAYADEERVDVDLRDPECVVCKEVPREPMESDCCGQPFYGNIH